MVKTGPKMAQKPSEHLIECEINTSFDLTEQMQTRRKFNQIDAVAAGASQSIKTENNSIITIYYGFSPVYGAANMGDPFLRAG